MTTRRRLLGGTIGLGLAIVAAVGISGRDGPLDDPATAIHPPDREPRLDRDRVEGQLPSLAGATGWLNTEPLTAADLRGKVVVVELWTYSCINWRRQLPYVRAWFERYAPQGLVVIGVHSPEFEFERENVDRAVREMEIPYPIAIDSDFAIWNAFANHYWPALYFIDARGRIRHHQFGEGDYETSEMVIRQLLAEAGHTVEGDLAPVDPRGFEAQPALRDLLTPETYAGYARTERFRSPGGARRDVRRVYSAPPSSRLADWALAGTWTMRRESAVLDEAGGRSVFRFHARDLHMVMGAGSRVRFRIRIDGQPPGAAHGLDVDDAGNGVIIEPRVYQLVRQPLPIRDRDFEIEFLDAGAALYSFTFG